jgi:DNA-binding GntR family transcriptional regulator
MLKKIELTDPSNLSVQQSRGRRREEPLMPSEKTSGVIEGDGRFASTKVLQKEQAYEAIKHHLFNKEDTSSYFSERLLAAELALGLASVRSAIERLRSEGIVETIPKAGIRLPQISHAEIMDFYEVRLVIEPYIARRVAERVSKAQCEKLAGMIRLQKQAAAEQDTHTYHTMDLAFHNLLAEIHGNREMARSLKQLWDKMYRLSRRIHQRQVDHLSVNVEQHEAIVNAICAQQPDEAARAMESHLIWGRTYALDPEGRLTQSRPDAIDS